MTGWLYLIAAGVLEIGFASMIKPTENFTKVIPTIVSHLQIQPSSQANIF